METLPLKLSVGDSWEQELLRFKLGLRKPEIFDVNRKNLRAQHQVEANISPYHLDAVKCNLT